jgi:hypothetical protein
MLQVLYPVMNVGAAFLMRLSLGINGLFQSFILPQTCCHVYPAGIKVPPAIIKHPAC